MGTVMSKTIKTPAYVKMLPGKKSTIVLLHGFLSSKRYWQKVATHLQASGHQVIMIDLLGFGHAPKPTGIRYDYEDHLAHIHKTLGALNILEPVMMAGHSMGALLAVKYAHRYPKRVKAVGLMNPPIYLDRDQAYHTLRNTGPLYRFLLESKYRHICWLLLRKIGPFGDHSRDSREGSLKNLIIDATFTDDLETLQKPAILLIGEKDRAIYGENIQGVQVSKSLSVHVGPSGHHAPITHHVSVAHHILSLV